jgi:hypothetical protein
MAAVTLAARRRLTHRWRAVAVAGILLGLGFGLCFTSIAAARRTLSAYDRILAAADAPDAAVAHGSTLEASERSLRTVAGITGQRAYAGFRGVARGVDAALTSALIAPAGDQFPLELPVLRSGRLPQASAADEVFVNAAVADGADLDVGDHLDLRLFAPGSSRSAEVTVTVVGIGTRPVEVVSDETMVSGLVVFTRAFYELHGDLATYSASSVDLAPGFDARRELATAVDALGHDVQSARAQERDSVNEALRPLIIVLAALGVLAFVATAVATTQVIQRERDRSRADAVTMGTLGMARNQLRLVELAVCAVLAGVAVTIAVTAMWLASAVAPIGPLHDLDPGRGRSVDPTVVALGVPAVTATVFLITLFTSRTPRPAAMSSHSPWPARAAQRPATLAGLTMAFRSWRPVTATTAATVLLALCATFVSAAARLTETPASYGFDADLVALNAYGDQPVAALDRTFGEADDVDAATAFTSVTFLLDGRAVPGLAATALKGDLTPTILAGRQATADDELVVGGDTLSSLGASVGDRVQARMSTEGIGLGDAAGDPVELRIVGVAAFPPVNQIGTDVPRLGVGALVTRDAFVRMGGNRSNGPEFSAVRLAEGAHASAVIARAGDGFRDAARTETTWFTGTEPAEIRQLAAARPYLLGAIGLGYVVLVALVGHALWTRARSTRRDLSVLRALGCTGRQLDTVVAWQALPIVLAALVVGIPVGVATGRWAFTQFARSLAVVEEASTTFATVGALVGAVLAATTLALGVGLLAGRRARAAAILRAS